MLVASSATPVVDDAVEAVGEGAGGDASVPPEGAEPVGTPGPPVLPPVAPSGSDKERSTGGETALSTKTPGDGCSSGSRSSEEGDSGAEVAVGVGAGPTVAAAAGPELGMSTEVGEEGRRAAARRTVHAEDSALLEDISFVEQDLENPGKLQVCYHSNMTSVICCDGTSKFLVFCVWVNYLRRRGAAGLFNFLLLCLNLSKDPDWTRFFAWLSWQRTHTGCYKLHVFSC